VRTGRGPRKAGTCPSVAAPLGRKVHPSSSPDCHEKASRYRACEPVSRRNDYPTDASRTGIGAGPVLVLLSLPAHNPCGSGLRRRSAGVALLADRHTHRRKRSLIRTPGISPARAALRRHRHHVGDAGSVRWIAILGRACRRHRQLLSTQGNGGVIRHQLASVSASLRRSGTPRELLVREHPGHVRPRNTIFIRPFADTAV
jgi:hypothetical protein